MTTKKQIEMAGYLDRILKSYESYFDISRSYRILDWEVPAYACFSSRSERYILSKKAKLWGAEANEHLFFFCEKRLDADRWEQIRQFMIRSEAELVKPHSEHMYSYLSAIILCEEITEEVKYAINSFRFHKNYKFSWYGWMTMRVTAVSLPAGNMVSNRAGRDIQKHLERIIERDASCR